MAASSIFFFMKLKCKWQKSMHEHLFEKKESIFNRQQYQLFYFKKKQHQLFVSCHR
jgi:hypothetical protein